LTGSGGGLRLGGGGFGFWGMVHKAEDVLYKRNHPIVILSGVFGAKNLSPLSRVDTVLLVKVLGDASLLQSFHSTAAII